MKLIVVKQFVITVLAVFFTSFLMAQDPEIPMKLEECSIRDLENHYNYTGSVINVSFSVMNMDGDFLDPDVFTSQFSKNGVLIDATDIIEEASYKLTLTARDNTGYIGTVSKDFYVVASHPLDGTGEPHNPYLINNETDWIEFAANSTYWGEKTFVRLASDITVGEIDEYGDIARSGLMAGDEDNPYTGFFDGDGNTLTFYCQSNGYSYNKQPVAPFRYTNNAVFENLTVAGEVKTTYDSSAGLIGINTGTTRVNNVVVSVFVNSGYYDDYDLGPNNCGGFAVDAKGVRFDECVFDGVLEAWDFSGGFCGMGNSTTCFNRCLFNPSRVWFAGSTFVFGDSDYYGYELEEPLTMTDSYYTETDYYYSYGMDGGDPTNNLQGVEAKTIIPPGNIGHYETNIIGNNVFVLIPIEISGVDEDYPYTGSDITIDYHVTYDGGADAIAAGICTAVITNSTGDVVENVNAAGVYHLVVAGNTANDYHGSKIKTFSVVDGYLGKWSYLQAMLDSQTTIDLDSNYRASNTDGALIINRDVVINLNGHTVDRHLATAKNDGWVFVIRSGKNVMINGEGTITGGYNRSVNDNENDVNDGGGINNKGNLTLVNVTVTGNKCVKKSTGTARTARGGGIYSGSGSRLSIKGGKIGGNAAEGGGGGIYAKDASLFEMTDAVVSGNECLDKGGGLRIKCKASLVNCEIRNNRLKTRDVSDGGGLYMEDGTLELLHCTIKSNQATRQGGGIYTMGGTTTIYDCSINDNFSYDYDNIGNENYGGGISIYKGTVTLTDVTITSNLCRDNGGGVYVREGGGKLKLNGKVVITGNSKIILGETKETNNVYLADRTSNGYMTIMDGFDEESIIGVSKNHSGNNYDGVLTRNLYNNGGTVANFLSDNEGFQVFRKNDEAYLDKPEPWNPSSPDDYIISEAWIVNDYVNTGNNTVTFEDDGCLIIVENGCLESPITNTDPNKIVLYGGQLVTNSPNVKATAKKDIKAAYDYNKQNWYTLASPFNNTSIIEETNLIVQDGNGNNDYDLYRFNESVPLQWENYRSHVEQFTKLQNGRGYIYRNDEDYTIMMTGEINIDAVKPRLSCTDIVDGQTNKLKGFNLIGNPYPHDIYKNDVYSNLGALVAINDEYLTVGYYRLFHGEGLQSDEFRAVIGYNNPIKPLEGVLVQTTVPHFLVINNSTDPAEEYNGPVRSDDSRINIMFEVSKGDNKDVAYAMFCNGTGLDKIDHLNAETPMLYINQDGGNYAIATMNDDTKAFNLHFKAMSLGSYTLNVKPEGDFDYIHVFDKLANTDVDMLAEGEYTFIGTPSDSKDRFVVFLGNNICNDDNDNFAYQSGSDIIVNGMGELQVFDLAGRLVSSQYINGVEMVEKPSQTGVYVLRLVGNDVKTQKIVVR